ncbi:hypothetical protein XELAEV_18014679mg [Xenopus laevis]|uniref:SprT-like domain-containing protein n=1 Tax=Xenopus laevis TaxID=8355 RepID=A0A974DGP3_XENLA|nr:hypothetical protein XELAEV_18014679mg [Xenopus laevis]
MIHAYFFIMDLKDDDDHGKGFRFYMRYIDNVCGTKLKIEHEFEDEVEALKRHWWSCDGPCGKLEKRATNRSPDTKEHKRKCGGKFVKIAEPDEPPKKKEDAKEYSIRME